MSEYERQARHVRAITGITLLLFIGAIAAIHALTPDQSFSESENRVLERRPSFSLRSLLSGTFATDYERYVSDQFAMRDFWIGMKTGTDLALGKKDSNGVYWGADGYLLPFFASPSDEVAKARIAAIHTFHEATPALRKFMMLAPTAASLHRDKLPPYAPVGDEQAVLQRIRQELEPMGPNVRFVDVYAALYRKRDEPIMYKTDHHWTTRGAYYAYRELCERMGIVPQDEAAFHIQEVTDAFYGSLYSKSGYRHVQPDRIELYVSKAGGQLTVEYVEEGRITDSLYELDNLDKKDQYTVFMDGNHSLVRITTEHADGKKLLVVKDSYANSLIPFLTEHFAAIDVVDLRYYGESLTELAQDRSYDEMLLLYHLQTFFEDAFILNIAD